MGRRFLVSLAPPSRSFTVLLLSLATAGAYGATNYVTTLADSGPGSLRDTIAASAPGDAVAFSTGGGSVVLLSELSLQKDLSIYGPGRTNLEISGNQAHRIFLVQANVTAVIASLTLRDGHAANGTNGVVRPDGSTTAGTPGEPGGAIWNSGRLTLLDCTVRNNSAGSGGSGAGYQNSASPGADGGSGGAIYSTGTLTLSNCLVLQNGSGSGGTSGTANTYSQTGGQGGAGGAIYSTGPLGLYNTEVKNNQTGSGASTSREARGAPGGFGAGVWCNGTMLAADCLFSSNITGSGGSGGPDSMGGGSGAAGGAGGGIWCGGPLTLTNCVVNSNRCGGGGDGGGGSSGSGFATSGGGGRGGSGCGLYTTNTALLLRCTISGNQGARGGNGGSGDNGASGASGSLGAGIYALGELTLTSCTVSSNLCGDGGNGGSGHAPYGPMGGYGGGGGWGGSGAGIHAASALRMTNCTVSDNVCGTGGQGATGSRQNGGGGDGGSGAGIFCTYPGSNTFLVSCTVTRNRAGLAGSGPDGPGQDGHGGLVQQTDNASGVLNMLIAGNSGLAPDVSGSFTSYGHNLVGVTNGSSGFGVKGDRIGSTNTPLNSLVGALADNGGGTWTCELLPGSPALEAGTTSGAPAADQRGVSRPQGGLADIGALEHVFTVPFISGAGVSGPNFRVQCCGLPQRQYVLQWSTNLVNWSDLETLTGSDTGAFEYMDVFDPQRQLGYYRLEAKNP